MAVTFIEIHQLILSLFSICFLFFSFFLNAYVVWTHVFLPSVAPRFSFTQSFSHKLIKLLQMNETKDQRVALV